MGVVEELKGKTKEGVGHMTDNEKLQAEGEAQADKGREETRQTEHEAKAQAHEKAAGVAEERQEAAEKS